MALSHNVYLAAPFLSGLSGKKQAAWQMHGTAQHSTAYHISLPHTDGFPPRAWLALHDTTKDFFSRLGFFRLFSGRQTSRFSFFRFLVFGFLPFISKLNSNF
jgi:hypothetical protein